MSEIKTWCRFRFRFNAWQGPVPEAHRALSGELTQALIARKQVVPEMDIGRGQQHAYAVGSANFTRRNLHDFNLETNVLVQTVEPDDLIRQMSGFFETQWSNTNGRTYSVPYEEFANDALWLRLQYRFMEATGLSTF